MPARRDVREWPWRVRYKVLPRVASSARRMLVQGTHLHCRVEFKGPVHIGPGFQLDILAGGSFVVGRDVEFRRGFACEIAGDGYVEIGDGTVFTSNALVQCTTAIVIGPRCAFGQSALIFDGTHRYADAGRHWGEQGWDFEPITIGAGVGVSDKCTIHASIGERAMIASHSVVNRPIPAYSVAAGVPARVVRRFGPSGEPGSGDAAPGADVVVDLAEGTDP